MRFRCGGRDADVTDTAPRARKMAVFIGFVGGVEAKGVSGLQKTEE